MRMHLQVLMLVLLAAACACAAEGVRNPFWPKGYVGEMTPISAEARPKPKPKPKPNPKAAAAKSDLKVEAKAAAAAKAAAEKAERERIAKAEAEARAAREAAEKAAAEKAAREAELRREITREDWKKAMKSLKIGNPAVITAQDGQTRSTISINGNIYVDGDLMSVTHENIRFTWRIQGLEGGKKLRLERQRARRIVK